MKKSTIFGILAIIFGIISISIGVLGLIGSNNDVYASSKYAFTTVETASDYKVMYHNKTKVMYVMSYDTHLQGVFTLLVDENGDPLLYDGE